MQQKATKGAYSVRVIFTERPPNVVLVVDKLAIRGGSDELVIVDHAVPILIHRPHHRLEVHVQIHSLASLRHFNKRNRASMVGINLVEGLSQLLHFHGGESAGIRVAVRGETVATRRTAWRTWQ